MNKKIAFLFIPFLCGCSRYPYGIFRFKNIRDVSKIDIADGQYHKISAIQNEFYATVRVTFNNDVKDYLVSEIEDTRGADRKFKDEEKVEITGFLETYFFLDRTKMLNLFPEKETSVNLVYDYGAFEFVVPDDKNEPSGNYKSFIYRKYSGKNAYLVLCDFSHVTVRNNEIKCDSSLISFKLLSA